MKTVNRFMLKSYLGPMVMTFFIVMFILLLNFLWRYIDELVGKGLPFNVILELLFYATSTMMPMGLPLATLLAAIMTMGNLGENNELLALKAAGISLPKIMRPIVYVALFISVSSFFIINNFVPYSYEKMGTILYDIRQQRQDIEFKDGVFFSGIPDVSIRVAKQDPTTRLLTDVLIYDNRDKKKTSTIVADSGYIDLSKDRKFLRMNLFKGQMYEDNRDYQWYDNPSLRHHIFSEQQLFIELEGFSFERSGNSIFGDNSQSRNIKELSFDIDSLGQITFGDLEKMVSEMTHEYLFRSDTTLLGTDSLIASKARFELGTRIEELTTEKKEELFNSLAQRIANLKGFAVSKHSEMRPNTIKYLKSRADWHKKLSLPISILIFFLIGAPLGAIIRKGGLGTPIVISVIFFVIYYIITMTGEKMVHDGAWPAVVGIWLSSIILFPLAIFLTVKATSDSQLLNIEAYIAIYKSVKEFIIKIFEKINPWNKRAKTS